jgi:phosphoribosyl 1,2-cyclic phosphodiesterase
MRVVSLGSGSSGNALLVEAGPQRRTKLLVDAGLSARNISERLRSVGVHPGQLQGILITHEHSDHVLGLPLLTKRYSLPIITDPRTYQVIEQSLTSGVWRTDSGTLIPAAASIEIETQTLAATSGALSYRVEENLASVDVENENENENDNEDSLFPSIALPVNSQRTIGDIEVASFSISHDAIAPCGYLLSAGGCRVCIVTDSGEVTPDMLQMMRQADLLIIEANHDRERLLRGPYPQNLKMRILSSTGHLSNDQAADAILRTWRTDSVRWLWLSHLSRTNNTPALALRGVRTRLQEAGANLAQVHISTLPPGMGRIWDSTQLWQATSLWDIDQ